MREQREVGEHDVQLGGVDLVARVLSRPPVHAEQLVQRRHREARALAEHPHQQPQLSQLQQPRLRPQWASRQHVGYA